MKSVAEIKKVFFSNTKNVIFLLFILIVKWKWKDAIVVRLSINY